MPFSGNKHRNNTVGVFHVRREGENGVAVARPDCEGRHIRMIQRWKMLHVPKCGGYVKEV